MSADEQYVRSKWAMVNVDENLAQTICLDERFFLDWGAAAEFTRERIEQVRQIDTECAIIRFDISKWSDRIRKATRKVGHPDTEWLIAATMRCVGYSRILSRLQAIRGELTKGMKEETQ